MEKLVCFAVMIPLLIVAIRLARLGHYVVDEPGPIDSYFVK